MSGRSSDDDRPPLRGRREGIGGIAAGVAMLALTVFVLIYAILISG